MTSRACHDASNKQTEIPILIMWNDTEVPLAYFISFRTASTWLHGDKRGSIDRFHNRYGSPIYLPMRGGCVTTKRNYALNL